MTHLSPEQLRAIEQVLDRQVPIQALQMLLAAINNSKKSAPPLAEVAVGFDSNVFLKLSGHPQRADIVDYFAARHNAPLILPGQAIQEFWNNQYAAIQTVATQVGKHFGNLNSEVSKIDNGFGDLASKFRLLIDELDSEYGYIRDKATITHLSSICNMLAARATVSYVPRMRFHELARQRKFTKTPPGFKDDGDGDFYIWADFLGGLLDKKECGDVFSHVVLITDDKKIDWSLAGVAHPILSAEIFSLLGASFDVWSLDMLGRQVSESLNSGP